ncbi:hypothetical protein GUITHDRAFT_109865 [Guillardia theta CCMP2712]|uniref:Uncharacterized protein n=1 Tax=Guillardia theta (strain CCMP2712) TaxID=905079 RepID=L1J6B4_GUITC|nr:hypothetical protein GUITHDRAFT_109865 [Guillardia theta CCMP2712]EKX44083.1 hypothetical protein GUITHDRAFT_109865 [Guillardia theta CCMP2712]|eukprot:XP_005831063.1 hypothetical protein GUITHDRAFT_109865 [Guillardia theta CCMP2712]
MCTGRMLTPSRMLWKMQGGGVTVAGWGACGAAVVLLVMLMVREDGTLPRSLHSKLAQRTYGLLEEVNIEELNKCDEDKDSDLSCEDERRPEVAGYTKEWTIPRGLGYYHVSPEPNTDSISSVGRSKRPAHNAVGWQWGQTAPTPPFKNVRDGEDSIPQGIGYYRGDSAKEEEDIIPQGLNYYKGATDEYDQDYLRDPTYFDQAYRLAYPKLPDQDNRAKFFDDEVACTASGEPLRC